MKGKHIYTIDAILILVSAFGLMFLFGYSTPNVIAPLDGTEINSAKVLFSIENADYIIISKDKDFTYPNIYGVEDGLSITLEPGFYYWKAKGVTETPIKTFTIKDTIILEIKEDEEGYKIINGGSKNLNVEVYNGTELVDEVALKTSEEMEVEGTKFIGSEE